MNKPEAIKRIKEIQNGDGDNTRQFPDELKGSLFKSIESGNKNIGDDVSLSYGFEYGEIHGLMKAFDLKVDDVIHFEEREKKKLIRKEQGRGFFGNEWYEHAKCQNCGEEGHYGFTPIGDYVYATRFKCEVCGADDNKFSGIIFTGNGIEYDYSCKYAK